MNIMGWKRRDYFWNLFKKLKIFSIISQHTFSLFLFVVNNKDQFIADTRQSTDLCLPQKNLAVYQKGVYYLSIKIIHHLPNNPKKCKTAFKNCLHINTFTSLDEYFNVNKKMYTYLIILHMIILYWISLSMLTNQ
jgi:hypothetical protein